MKDLAAYFVALLALALATYLLIENVKVLATAHVLLGVIVGLYLLAATILAPAQMNAARGQLAAWWTAYRGPGAPPPPTGGMGVVG